MSSFSQKKKRINWWNLIWMQSYWYLEMEHGSFSDHSKSTFSLSDEDHTLANSVRFVLNQELVLFHPTSFFFGDLFHG